MSVETSPAVQLRQQVVSRVVGALIILSFVELVLIGMLILFNTPVPGELWQSFAASTAALIALLVNTKVDAPAAAGTPVTVVNTPDNPVQTESAEPPMDAELGGLYEEVAPEGTPEGTRRPRKRA